jgi:hypothetical protein
MPTLNEKLAELSAYATELTHHSSMAHYDSQSTELLLKTSQSWRKKLIVYLIGLGVPTLVLAGCAQFYINDETIMGFVFIGWCVAVMVAPITIATSSRSPSSSLFLTQKELHSTQPVGKIKPRKVHISKIQKVVCRTRVNYWTFQRKYEYWVVFTEPYARQNAGKNGFNYLKGKLAFQVFVISGPLLLPQTAARTEFEGLALLLNEWLKLYAKHQIEFQDLRAQ